MHKCPKCGTEFEGKFCSECGYSFLQSAQPAQPAPAFNAPAPAQPTATPPKEKKNYDKLYLILHYLPAILLGLFSVLVFALLAAPAVKLTISGLGSASESGYEILKDQSLSSLKGAYVAMIVFGCLGALGAVLTTLALHKHPATKFHPMLVVGFAFYAVFLVLASVAIAQVKKLDGGAGLLSAGACPIVLLVFSILFALGTVGGVIGTKFLPSSYLEQDDKINLKDSKVFKWVAGHKKLVSALAAVAVVVVVIGSLIPTFMTMSKNGTYYACYNGEIDEEEYIVLKNGKWTDETGASGTYSVSGNKITVRIHDDFSNTTLSVSGTVSSGVLKLQSETINATYRTENHKHKCVDIEQEENSNGLQTQVCNCGLVWEYTSGLSYDGSAVTGIGTASGDVIIPYSYNGKSITKIENYAFERCSSLTSVTIPNSVTKIEKRAFRNCDGLTSVTIPNSVTKIGKWAFDGCSGLTSITIPNSVTKIGDGAFSDCNNLTSINVDEGNTVYHSTGNCLIRTKKKELVSGCKDSIIPTDGSVTSIGAYAFDHCRGLTDIIIPNSVTKIEELAFYYCTSLTSITIPNSVTKIGDGAFLYCTSLTSITYQGTKAQWNAIKKGSDWNHHTGNYTVHCTDGDIKKS